MISLFLLLGLIFISSIIILARNPLSIGVLILLMSLFLTIIISRLISSWLGFLIFLIYVRGILVLFSYFVALEPNQYVSLSFLSSPVAIIIITLVVMSVYGYQPVIIIRRKFLVNIYTQSSAFILIILALVLLFTMVVVVKLVPQSKGPDNTTFFLCLSLYVLHIL